MKSNYAIFRVVGLFLCLGFGMMSCDNGDSKSDNGNPNPDVCQLSGRTTYATDGSPVPNIFVYMNANGQRYADMFTDVNGDYSFEDVPFGEYVVVFDSQDWDIVTTTLDLNTASYTYDVQLTVRYPQILEAHGHIDASGGISHYQFYDVRVYDERGVSSVTAHLSDMSGQNTVSIDLADGDQDGDLEGEYLNTAGVNFTYSFGIRVVDTDGYLAEEFYTFE